MFSAAHIPIFTRLYFLPDFTEHPKPHHHHQPHSSIGDDSSPNNNNCKNPPEDNDDEDEITFFHDFIAGGVAGSASVIVGHPFDTMKVRMQTSTSSSSSWRQSIRDFGGPASLFRGMAAPLGAAAVINAVVFGSYGFSSRLYDQWRPAGSTSIHPFLTHDPWQKSFCCGAFAGFVQAFIICPLEHIKCRLQTQQQYRGPIDCLRSIVRQHGVLRLYQGWCTTLLREIPAFGLYFSTYDYLKDLTNNYLVQLWASDSEPLEENDDTAPRTTTHTWVASAIAGGFSGSFTWAIVYPVDLIKSQVQTAALTTPYHELRMIPLARAMVQRHGNLQCLFRGLNITLLRAFPVNGTIFPVYEFTLKQMTLLGL